MRRYISLIFFLLVTTLVASFAGAFSPGEWYQGLNKPEWTPPNWLFGPVWSVLYLFIAIAGWLVWRAKGFGLALFLWFGQLALNGAWSYLMFGENRIDSAMIDLMFMWLAIAAFMVTSWRLSRLAVLLFVPYLIWVTFAGALNFALLQLNP
ncbi:MAG: sensory protein TspO [Alphaproteobacteria bacterium BRH_c36]|nr:MAG: sensory protein TspO [Alphaproteobacteria bacterium BRH_c36]